MFCPHCGAQNNESATVCAECGQALKTTAVGSPGQTTTPPPFGEANPPAQTTPPPGAPPLGTPPPPAAPIDPASAARREGAHPRVVPAVATDEDDDPNAADTGVSIMLGIFAFLFPPLGIGLYFFWHRKYPRTAQQMLIIGLASLILMTVMYRFAL